ncbi:SMP-30/gluconolactonase/LRE family protein [Parasalinivibrio latis]|uniref:SMP-30/gluconolactonase/LRE family protein n=1 Tax=Parasalinivibrio latis TaxID=2952610 RepID=UPI0030E27E78
MGISVLNRNVEILVDCQNVVGESPLWCAEKQALYWVATLERKIFCFFMDSGVVQHWDVPEIPGCIALGDNGDLIVAMESGIFEVSLSGHKSRISLLQKCPPSFNGMRFNDGKCDRQGRFLAGSMKFPLSPEAAGVLYRLDHNKHLSPVIHGLITQNGLAWSPDGKKMYLSDSHPSRQVIWEYEYDIHQGLPHHRKLFVDMRQHGGRPDGAAVDIDGCYWCAANDGWQLLRFTPDGKVDQRIPLPFSKPSMCAFGGEAMDTLFITSIHPNRDRSRMAEQPFAGCLAAINPGTQGLKEAAYKAY